MRTHIQHAQAILKATFLPLCVLVTLLLFTSVAAQSGGAYDLSWSTGDGGGGESSGGDFTINGTVGQPDAGDLSGGDYTVSGGFWQPGTTVPPTAIYLDSAQSSSSYMTVRRLAFVVTVSLAATLGLMLHDRRKPT